MITLDRSNLNPGEDDKLSNLETAIENGDYDDDQITAVQTLDSIISSNPGTIDVKTFANWLSDNQAHDENVLFSELRYVGKLKRRISRLEREIKTLNADFSSDRGNNNGK